MSLRDLLPKGPLRQRFGSDADSDTITVSDLQEEFGNEAVRRGIAYMASLSDAERNYKNSADEKNFVQEQLRGVGQPPEQVDVNEEGQEANDRWRQGQKRNGLGLNKEDE